MCYNFPSLIRKREGGLYGTANCRPLSSSGRAAGTRPHQHDALPRDVGRGVPLRRGPEVVHRTPGLCVAAEHLLGLYPAFGLLPAAGASSVPAGSRRLRGRGAGHSRHPALPARGRGVVRGADPAWLVHAPHRRAGPAVSPCPARRGRGPQRPAVLGDLPHDERLLEPPRGAAGPAAGPLRRLHHGLLRLHAQELFLHRLFPAAALAVSVLGGVLPPPPRTMDAAR